MPGRPKQHEQLPGLETQEVARNLSSRNAFGRVPKLEYFGIDPSIFADVTPDELRAIVPENALIPRLYGMQTGNVVDGLALHPKEYEAIVRSPRAFTVAVTAKTAAARVIDTNIERREETTQRSVQHAKTSKASRAGKVIEGLSSQASQLARLSKEIKSPGYAHMSEADMRILAETARSSFDNILYVVGIQANWTPYQQERAGLAMNARLFDTDYKQAFSYWKRMTNLSLQYTDRKISLFKRRQKQLS